MIPFIQVHWLAILFGEYLVLVLTLLNVALDGSILEISDFNLKHLEYFFIFFFGLPLFLIEYFKELIARRFNDG